MPNIKVFQKPGSNQIDQQGLTFYKEVISRYISLELFDEDALVSLFRLSAGIVRDMIRNTGDACAYAVGSDSGKVLLEHTQNVWYETMRYYRNQLYSEDYEVIKKVDEEPYIQGINEIPRLLHSKAIVFYPNAEGWYGVHPAIKRMLGLDDNVSG